MSSIEKVKHLQIPLQDILLATKGFADENFIANGGFGKVYKGLSEKHGHVAIKRLDRGHGQGDHEFKTEIALLSEYRHENIVSLLGFCDDDGEKILAPAPALSPSEVYVDPSDDIDFQFSGGNVSLVTNMDAWDQKLSQAKTQGKIVIANFSASWCGVCRSFSHYYIELSEKHPSLMFLTINADKLTKLSIQWSLKVTPTFIFLRDGQQIDKLEGASNSKLQKKIKTVLDSQVRHDQKPELSFHHDEGLKMLYF
ncbi:hypothetical protein L1987_79363 [Smallanthus sonchifolius]|uniref:Uncharacterized protein n=1 Tax=Smallanthus sonchifolius TaxID=185202 RepID=A0ACB8ZF76_9ASTR|nr:hypothetical protein L1987_79363 [Smallanthus sonchifolius]